jgi:hypothetical protein
MIACVSAAERLTLAATTAKRSTRSGLRRSSLE